MRITKLQLKNFKFFSDLTIENIPRESEIVLLVGPNGTGKSCVFDAFNYFAFRSKHNTGAQDDEYYKKEKDKTIEISFFDGDNNKIDLPVFGNRMVNFYGRSSYRFTSKIQRESISSGVAARVFNDQDAPTTYSELDQRIENDIEKALGEFIQAVQAQTGKTDKEIVNQVIGKLNESLKTIFPDSSLQLKRIIDPHSDSNSSKIDLEFSKDKNIFRFRNLSSGEKEVVDIIFNFHRRKDTWIKDGIYFIDEPELHLNTKIQALLLRELHRLCKEVNAQLWIATHSLGFLREAQDLKRKNSSLVAIIEFKQELANNIDPVKPIRGARDDWKRIFQTALEDITGLMAPKIIIYCEGPLANSLDETIFNTIFSEKDDCLFVSATNKSESIKYAGVALTILNKAFDDVKIINLVDRDNEETIPKNSHVEIRKLERLEFENYLFDFEIIKKSFPVVTKDKYDKIVSDIENGNVKSRISDLITETEESISEKDFKIKLAKNIIRNTEIYKKLHKIIFE